MWIWFLSVRERQLKEKEVTGYINQCYDIAITRLKEQIGALKEQLLYIDSPESAVNACAGLYEQAVMMAKVYEERGCHPEANFGQ